MKIKCLSSFCDHFLSESTIKLYTSAIQFEEYLAKKREIELSANPNFRWCPSVNCKGYCQNFVDIELTCNTCGIKFCYFCGETVKKKTQLSDIRTIYRNMI